MSIFFVAVQETACSVLYGIVDVLLAAGNIWQSLVRSQTEGKPFQLGIISPEKAIFCYGNSIPVNSACSIADNPDADIVILAELRYQDQTRIPGTVRFDY